MRYGFWYEYAVCGVVLVLFLRCLQPQMFWLVLYMTYHTYFYVVVKVRPTSLSSHTPFLLLSTLEVTRMINVFVVFTLNRSFYPVTSAVPPVSLLILHPREIKITWTQLSVRQTKPTRYVKNQGRHIKC